MIPSTLSVGGSSVPDMTDTPDRPSFDGTDLRGARFTSVDLTDAVFRRVRLRGAHIRGADLENVRMEGVEMFDVTIEGDVRNLTINGVEVTGYISDELDRREPDRLLLRPTTAEGYRTAWELLERRWAETVERARALGPERLHESVDGEWSFVETQRHLLFVTDAWVRRGILREPEPWHPLDLPWDEMPEKPGIPRDRAVRPSLDEVLVPRAERQRIVRELVAGLTDERLDEEIEPLGGDSWPPVHVFKVRECLDVLIEEEWWHRRFAERDLAVLTGAATA